MPKKQNISENPSRPVTYIDSVYSFRQIAIGDDVVRVEHGRVSVDNIEHIAELDAMYGLERETKKGAG